MNCTRRKVLLRIGVLLGCLVFVVLCIACGKDNGGGDTQDEGSKEPEYVVSTDENGSITYVPVSSGDTNSKRYTVSVGENGSKTYVPVSSKAQQNSKKQDTETQKDTSKGEDTVNWDDLWGDDSSPPQSSSSSGTNSTPPVVPGSSSSKVSSASSVASKASMPANASEDAGWGPWVPV